MSDVSAASEPSEPGSVSSSDFGSAGGDGNSENGSLDGDYDESGGEWPGITPTEDALGPSGDDW
jgi:hypothetical protein